MSVTQKMVGVPTPVIIMKEEGTVVVMLGTLSLRTERTVTVSNFIHVHIHSVCTFFKLHTKNVMVALTLAWLSQLYQQLS